MYEGMFLCAGHHYRHAADTFKEIVRISNADAYHIPAMRCEWGLCLLALEETEAAREQFALALAGAHELSLYPALIGATYELDRMAHPQKSLHERRQVLAELATELGTPAAVGRSLIHVGATYMTMGFRRRARQLLHISLKLLWGNVQAREMARHTLTIAKLLAAGLGGLIAEKR